MKKIITVPFLTVLITSTLLIVNSAQAATWIIGDNDGYGIGIPDNAPHTFDGFNANFDGRSMAEMNATNGAQYTDTYSTSHPGFSPQSGTLTTFTFTGLGNGWTEGSMWFDMADFQASEFGAVITTYNGINQNWAFNDGFPNTTVRFFDLAQDVIDSINATGELVVQIDRNASSDFYGFDYALLSDNIGENTTPPPPIPVPAAVWLFGSALLGFVGIAKQRRS